MSVGRHTVVFTEITMEVLRKCKHFKQWLADRSMRSCRDIYTTVEWMKSRESKRLWPAASLEWMIFVLVNESMGDRSR